MVKVKRKMKIITSLVLLLLSYIYGYGQYGTYGMTDDVENVSTYTTKLEQYRLLGYKGVKFTVRWKDDQPTISDLSHSYLLSNVKLAADSGMEILIQTWKGNNAPISPPADWLHTQAGVPTFMTTGGNINGPWPDYYHPNYIYYSDLYDRSLADSLKAYIARYPTVAAKLKGWFTSHGSTGDEGPIKGTPPPEYSHYRVDDTWYAFVQARIDVAYNGLAGTLPIALNPSNNGENIEPYYSRYTGVLFKHGDASHQYPVDGEVYSINWPHTIYFGEFDDEIRLSTYPADQFQCVRSFLSLKRVNGQFMNPWLYLNYTKAMSDFMNKYATQTNPVTANKGFIVLAEKVDFLDSVHYPISVYGGCFANNNSYWGNIRLIDNSTDDIYHKEQRYVAAAMNNMNPARKTALEAAGYKRTGEGEFYYYNDVAWYCTQNYGLNMTQILPYETSTGVFRIDDGTIYGRNARITKEYQGRRALYFDVDDNLIVSPALDKIEVSVTYKDDGDATWMLEASGCKKKKVVNTNTHLWKTVVFTLDKFKKGNKMVRMNSADIAILIISGADFPIEMIEVNNLSKPNN